MMMQLTSIETDHHVYMNEKAVIQYTLTYLQEQGAQVIVSFSYQDEDYKETEALTWELVSPWQNTSGGDGE